jgi:formyltetrahydrofolate synthetase
MALFSMHLHMLGCMVFQDAVCSSKYGVPVVVAINAFASCSKGEQLKMSDCDRKGESSYMQRC